MGRNGEGNSPYPRVPCLYKKGFRKSAWPDGDDVHPNEHFLIRFHFKVIAFSALFLIAILVAQSPTKEVCSFSFITNLSM